MPNPSILYLTGLPQAGANLIAQLLRQHPEIDSTDSTSPLCPALVQLRSSFSNHPAFTAGSRDIFDQNYLRYQTALRGLLNGWFSDCQTSWGVDHSPEWINHLELVQQLDPNCHVLVCVRELGQIFGSLEERHQKTLLLDYPEPLAHLSRADRARSFFEPTGIVGKPLAAIQSLPDLDETIQKRLYYVVFEHLVSEPQEAIQGIFNWLGLPSASVDLQQMKPASDWSHFKYSNAAQSLIDSPSQHNLPARFEVALKQNFRWFYETFYPGQLA